MADINVWREDKIRDFRSSGKNEETIRRPIVPPSVEEWEEILFSAPDLPRYTGDRIKYEEVRRVEETAQIPALMLLPF